MKKIFAILLSILIISCGNTKNETEQAKKLVEESYPNVAIESIEKINDSFFEVIIRGEVFYLSTDHKHLISGNLINIKTKENITETSRKKRRLYVLKELDPKNMVVYKPEQTKHVLTIFSDTSCPYCQKFHEEINKLVENNIEIRYVLFPRFGEDNDTFKKMISIWCSKDRNKALDNVFNDVSINTDIQCENPINENLRLAQKLSVAGTPTMFTEDGTIIPGYQPANEIINFLNRSN
ncbi:MAG: DsbC family protein [Pseudomonadota bacterium]|nr:DsbC family protein [Pseudomonadota bacterium]